MQQIKEQEGIRMGCRSHRREIQKKKKKKKKTKNKKKKQDKLFFFFYLFIRILEHFQTELEGNQIDYTTKFRTLQRGWQK